MKRLNIVLIAVVAAMLIFFLIFHVSSTLRVTVSGVAAPASNHIETFNSVVDILNKGSVPKRFTTEIPQSTEDIYLISVAVDIANAGFVKAQWVQADIIGASGDIAVYSVNGDECDIPAGSEAQIALKLITHTPEEPRSVRLTYYILGAERSVTVSF